MRISELTLAAADPITSVSELRIQEMDTIFFIPQGNLVFNNGGNIVESGVHGLESDFAYC